MVFALNAFQHSVLGRGRARYTMEREAVLATVYSGRKQRMIVTAEIVFFFFFF